MSVLMWSVLFLIAFYDLKENRIPNYCLILLLVLYVVDAFWNQIPINVVGINALAAVAMFASCLALFFLKVMAPGDVKLMGVLGYWIGWGNLLSTSFYILVSAGILGLLFILQDLARPDSKYRHLILLLDKGSRKDFITKENLRMPFAPAVFLGMVAHQFL